MITNLSGNVFDIQRGSFVDGPGIRTTVFLKGCNLRCKWCHNPESQKSNRQLMVHRNKCTGCGKCVAVCPHQMQSCDFCGACVNSCPNDAREICGKEMAVDEVFEIIYKDVPFYGAQGGVTISGGECMLQLDFLTQLLQRCHEAGIHTAVDTAGNVPWTSFQQILPISDLFLYDLKAVSSEVHKEYTGVDNQRILDNLRNLFEIGAPVWIRVPLIQNVNDTDEEIARFQEFLAPYHPQRIELLPYHAMGEHKYTALGMDCEIFAPPSPQRIAQIKVALNIA